VSLKIVKAFTTILIIIFSLTFFGYIATHRLIAQDEGFYLMAGKLVSSGKIPYLDFFYPQAPLLPYIFAAWGKIFGFTWVSFRVLMGLVSTLLAILIYKDTKDKTNYFLALFSILFFSLSIMSFPWFTITKGYALSTLFLFCAYILLNNKHAFFISGILVGLAGLIRLPLAGVAPVIVIWLYFFLKKDPHKYKKIGLFILGGLVTLLPTIYLASLNFDSFYYNNLGYHLERANLDDKRWHVAEILFGLRSGQKSILAQVPFFLYSTILFFIYSLYKKQTPHLSAVIAITLLIINLKPQVVYIQYFSVIMPFIIVASINFWSKIFISLKNTFNHHDKLLTLLAMLILFLFLAFYSQRTYNDIIRYSHNGQGVIGIGDYNIAKNWKLKNISEISKFINENSSNNDIIFSDWPGYLLETDREIINGLENHFAIDVASSALKKYNQSKLNNYKILTINQLSNIIKNKKATLVVSYLGRHKNSSWTKLALENGYSEIARINNVVILKQ
jgi:hypothetical protein